MLSDITIVNRTTGAPVRLDRAMFWAQQCYASSLSIGLCRKEDVRVWVDHITRSFKDEELKERFLSAVSRLLAPLISERGLRWEMHVDERPFSLWTIQGLRPPLPDSPAEKRWVSENGATPYEAAEARPR